MTLHYKFGIGDKVKLIKEPSFVSLSSSHRPFCEIKDKEFEIIGFGWYEREEYTITNESTKNMKKYYRLSVENGDNYLTFNNRVDEEYIEAVNDIHPFDEEAIIKSGDGCDLEIGMKVYWEIFRNWYNGEPNTRFTFSGYGTIVGIHKYKEVGKEELLVDTKREFLCKQENGRNWMDSRRYGNISYGEPAMEIIVNVPDNFAEEYVKTYIRNNDTYLEKDNSDYFAVTSYLDHIGVLNEVVDLYNKMKPVDNKVDKNRKKVDNDKLSNIIGQLTPEELEQLKKML